MTPAAPIGITSLPDIEEGGMNKLNLRSVQKYWSHLLPTGESKKLRRSGPDDRRPWLKEYSCAGGRTLRCQWHEPEGKIVFTLLENRGDGGAPAVTHEPFELFLRGSAATAPLDASASVPPIQHPPPPPPPPDPQHLPTPPQPEMPPTHLVAQNLQQQVQQLRQELLDLRQQLQQQVQNLQQQLQQQTLLGQQQQLLLQEQIQSLLNRLPPPPHGPRGPQRHEAVGSEAQPTEDGRHGVPAPSFIDESGTGTGGGEGRRRGGGGGDSACRSDNDNDNDDDDVRGSANDDDDDEEEEVDDDEYELDESGEEIDVWHDCETDADDGSRDEPGLGAKEERDEEEEEDEEEMEELDDEEATEGVATKGGGGGGGGYDDDDDDSEAGPESHIVSASGPFALPFGPEGGGLDGGRRAFEVVRAHVAGAFATEAARAHLEIVTRSKKNAKYATRIGGERFEVFLASENCSRVFYKILRDHPPCAKWLKDIRETEEWVRTRLLEELDSYVAEDPCLTQLNERRRGRGAYVRQVASLLISYGDVPAQSWHIDMKYPLYQGVLLLTPSPPTHVAPVQDVLNKGPGELQVKEFVDLLCQRLAADAGQNVKDDIIQAIRSVPEATHLVNKYGWLVASVEDKMAAHDESKKRLPGKDGPFCGYLGFPGSVVHRGPPCHAFRLTLFGSYGRKSDEPYDPTVQYSAPAMYSTLADWVVGSLKTKEAKLAFWRAGERLLLDDKDRVTDFYQYRIADWTEWDPKQVSDVSEGLLVATAQARTLQKTGNIDMDYDEASRMASRDAPGFYEKYFSEAKKRPKKKPRP